MGGIEVRVVEGLAQDMALEYEEDNAVILVRRGLKADARTAALATSLLQHFGPVMNGDACSGPLTYQELADRLGVSERSLRRRVAKNEIPYMRVGRNIRFTPEQVASIMDAMRRGAL